MGGAFEDWVDCPFEASKLSLREMLKKRENIKISIMNAEAELACWKIEVEELNKQIEEAESDIDAVIANVDDPVAMIAINKLKQMLY